MRGAIYNTQSVSCVDEMHAPVLQGELGVSRAGVVEVAVVVAAGDYRLFVAGPKHYRHS